MMNKNTILIVVICVATLIGGQLVINKIFPPIPKPARPATAVTNAPAATNAAATSSLAATNAAPELKPVAAEPGAPLPAEQLVTLSNQAIRVTFTSWGGGIRTVELLQFKSHTVGNVILNADTPVPALALVGWAGTNTAYELQQSSPTSIVLRAQAASGAVVTKEFSLGTDYVLQGQVRISAAPSQPVQLVVGSAVPANAPEGINFLGVDWLATDYQTRPFKKIAKNVSNGNAVEKVPAQWVGVKSQFFTMLVTPSTNAVAVGYNDATLPAPQAWNSKAPYQGVSALLELAPTPAADGTWTQTFTVYAGPKEYKRLAALGKGQEYLMDFGMFKVIAVWLLQSMLFIHKLIPNYGVAIILITIAIKLVFWPIQAKSIKSMKAMQQFQPLMAKIKEKYKDDAPRQQQEMMKLYKEHKINPFSGCLPMLVQIPVFFALYAMLRSSVELRGAHFLWIHDLSQPDTIFTIAGLAVNPLPLAMTLSMFWQQKLTPATGDAQQQKMMMYMMPVMMLFFLYGASSGLTLYWTVQQLLSIAQQWWSLRKPTAPVTVLPSKAR